MVLTVVYKVPIGVSLLVIATLIGVSVLVSLRVRPSDPDRRTPAPLSA